MRLGGIGWVTLIAAVAGSPAPALALPLTGDGGLLPAGTDLGEPALEVPRQILTIEREGSEQTFLIALGNLAFGSPEIMGGLARRAGISCNSCHISGEPTPPFSSPACRRSPAAST